MVQFIQDNGKTVCDMAEVSKFGKMAHIMKVIGLKIKQTDKADWSMLMEMSTKVYGLMIRLMDRVYISIPMEQFIAGIGLKISKKVMELKLGQM